jgi:predicted amidohydrolase
MTSKLENGLLKKEKEYYKIGGNMKVSLIQMNSKDNKQENIEKAIKFMDEAVNQNTDIICLSEKFLYWGNGRSAENIDSAVIEKFKEYAKKNNVNIILGSIALKYENTENITNTCFVINRNGEIIHRYDKIYMYTVDRPDLKIDEGNDTVKGNKLGIVEIDGVKIGIGICFDLRYPEYFKALALNGAEIMFLPSSFRKTTGAVAWEVLTKARAIENQAYFCACNQTGGIAEKERCGNTQIISYDGSIISNIDKDEGIIIADLDIEKLRRFRKEFPILKQIEKF